MFRMSVSFEAANRRPIPALGLGEMEGVWREAAASQKPRNLGLEEGKMERLVGAVTAAALTRASAGVKGTQLKVPTFPTLSFLP